MQFLCSLIDDRKNKISDEIKVQVRSRVVDGKKIDIDQVIGRHET